jgi:hypothetical protein
MEEAHFYLSPLKTKKRTEALNLISPTPLMVLLVLSVLFPDHYAAPAQIEVLRHFLREVCPNL